MATRTVLIPLDDEESQYSLVQMIRTYLSPEGFRLVLMRSVELPADNDSSPAAEANSLPSVLSVDDQLRESGDENLGVGKNGHSDLLRAQREILARDVQLLRSVGYTVTGEIRFGSPEQHIVDYLNGTKVAMVARFSDDMTQCNGYSMHAQSAVILRSSFVPVLLMN